MVGHSYLHVAAVSDGIEEKLVLVVAFGLLKAAGFRAKSKMACWFLTSAFGFAFWRSEITVAFTVVLALNDKLPFSEPS